LPIKSRHQQNHSYYDPTTTAPSMKRAKSSLLLSILYFFFGPSTVYSFHVVPPEARGALRTKTQWDVNTSLTRRCGTTSNTRNLDPEKDLRKILKPTSTSTSKESSKESRFSEDHLTDLSTTPYLEEYEPDAETLGDVPIPTTGISVADEMEKAYAERSSRFYSEVIRITGLADGVKAAQILSSTAAGGYEPVRYLIRLSRKEDLKEENMEGEDDSVEMTMTSELSGLETEDYVMVDVPPYSDKLVQLMKRMMGPNGVLKAILVTCRDNIHYDDTPGVFAIRRADLMKWEKTFPDVAMVAYRIDVPRDCRESITQRLDGFGPWALQDASAGGATAAAKNETFIETGMPLTYNAWDADIAMEILEGRQKPPREADNGNNDTDEITPSTNGRHTTETIRLNEEGKRVLAVYTPGRTYGSVSYVFPELGLCASGYTLPLEDTRRESWGMDTSAGPVLDCRGFITTNKAGISRQMESARKLANEYSDRFQIILPSRSDPFYLEEEPNHRQKTLLEIIDQYEKIGKVYEQLGITGSNGLK
jgi:hypothetical protein